jgi:hypothetical protein
MPKVTVVAHDDRLHCDPPTLTGCMVVSCTACSGASGMQGALVPRAQPSPSLMLSDVARSGRLKLRPRYAHAGPSYTQRQVGLLGQAVELVRQAASPLKK